MTVCEDPNYTVEYERVKQTSGKFPMHLILWKAVKWFIRIRLYGVQKYHDPSNWKQVKPIDWYDACVRHLVAYIDGENIDPESGLPHLAHALTNLWYLVEQELDEPTLKETNNAKT